MVTSRDTVKKPNVTDLRTRCPAPGRAGQRGQSAVFVLLFLGILLISLNFLYKQGRITTDKMELQNAADAVAYSISMTEARDLNFASYLNRAMVANEVAIGQLVGLAHPNMWLSDNRKRRENAIIRGMPTYLDFITMCVEAGLNFQGALQQAMEKAPQSPLKNEFAIVLRDLRSGLSRSDALRRMADRLDIQETTSFVSAVIQAERMGSSLATVMRVQAEQRRNERFQRAEKMAMEAPIKLVGPLILFIFPVTFIILGFPIAMKFLNEGIL